MRTTRRVRGVYRRVFVIKVHDIDVCHTEPGTNDHCLSIEVLGRLRSGALGPGQSKSKKKNVVST
jgi:hypothetical protein